MQEKDLQITSMMDERKMPDLPFEKKDILDIQIVLELLNMFHFRKDRKEDA